MEEFVEESLKEIEESLKKIMSSLQRQDKVISSMMGSYSNISLKILYQEPTSLLTHQELIILQEQLPLPTPT